MKSSGAHSVATPCDTAESPEGVRDWIATNNTPAVLLGLSYRHLDVVLYDRERVVEVVQEFPPTLVFR